MTPKQREAIEQHGRQLLAIFPNATEQDPVKLCRKLRRIETRANADAEDYCNGITDCRQYKILSGHSKARVHKGLGSDRPFINSDPRGYALKVELGKCEPCNGTGAHFLHRNTMDDTAEPCESCNGWGNERLHTDMGGYGIIAPEIGPDGR